MKCSAYLQPCKRLRGCFWYFFLPSNDWTDLKQFMWAFIIFFHNFMRRYIRQCCWPRALLKGPKRSFVVLVLLLVVVGVETWIRNGTNVTKQFLMGTKNVREQNLFLIEQKMFVMKIASNWTSMSEVQCKKCCTLQ